MPPAELPPVPISDVRSMGLLGLGAETHLACSFAASGLHVIMFDLVGPHATLPRSETATSDAVLAEPHALVVGVPVTLTRTSRADTTALGALARTLGLRLRRDQIVILTGPVPHGTTRTVMLPALSANGLRLGRDFSLAYTSDAASVSGPRVVGGFDPASAEAAARLFERLSPVVRVSSLEAAEVSGAVGAMSRTVQAAATNELKVACARMGVDMWEVLKTREVMAGAPTSKDTSSLLLAWGSDGGVHPSDCSNSPPRSILGCRYT